MVYELRGTGSDGMRMRGSHIIPFQPSSVVSCYQIAKMRGLPSNALLWALLLGLLVVVSRTGISKWLSLALIEEAGVFFFIVHYHVRMAMYLIIRKSD